MATATKSGAKPTKAKPAEAAKPVAKAAAKSTAKPAAKPAVKPAAAAAKPVAKPVKATKPVAAKKSVPSLPPEQRRFYVEVAAYYIAERRGFHGGSELNDWVEAENEIDRLLREGVLKP